MGETQFSRATLEQPASDDGPEQQQQQQQLQQQQQQQQHSYAERRHDCPFSPRSSILSTRALHSQNVFHVTRGLSINFARVLYSPFSEGGMGVVSGVGSSGGEDPFLQLSEFQPSRVPVKGKHSSEYEGLAGDSGEGVDGGGPVVFSGGGRCCDGVADSLGDGDSSGAVAGSLVAVTSLLEVVAAVFDRWAPRAEETTRGGGLLDSSGGGYRDVGPIGLSVGGGSGC